MTDGADKSRYLVKNFLQLFNQNFFYTFQQPNLAMDYGLIREWESKLLNRGVKIYKGEKAIKVERHIVITNQRTITTNTIILAMPPQYLSSVMTIPKWLHDYAKETAYNRYISVTMHFKPYINIDKIWGLAANSEWGLVFIKLTDYAYVEPEYQTVFTIAVTRLDAPGVYGKTALQCTANEIKGEVSIQMDQLFYFTRVPDKILIYEGNDKAFVHTKAGFKIIEADGIYVSGTHMGKSPYSFTSMESAICNAIYMINQITGSNHPIRKLWTVDVFIIGFIVVFIILIMKLF